MAGQAPLAFVFPHMSVVSMLRLCEVSMPAAVLCQLKLEGIFSKVRCEIQQELHDDGPQEEHSA